VAVPTSHPDRFVSFKLGARVFSDPYRIHFNCFLNVN
jgi:hypothetical protein